MKYNYRFCLLTFLGMISCTSSKQAAEKEITIHQFNDPEMLNPINYADARAGYILNHLFQKLIGVDYKHPAEIVPIIADSLPLIEKMPDGKMNISFRIKKEAKWDNQSNITARDVDFTLKAMKCPWVNNYHTKSFFDFIIDFKYDQEDEKSFTIVADTLNYLAQEVLAELFILPEYVYDSLGRLKHTSVHQMAKEYERIQHHPSIIVFANEFNAAQFMFDPMHIKGSGAYELVEWKKNEYITLVKKQKWWGEGLENKNCFFEAYPDRLVFKTISTITSAITALKAGTIQVMSAIKPKYYADITSSEKAMKRFNFFSTSDYSYLYVGFNLSNPFLKDIRLRKALAHLANVEDMIKVITYNQSQQVVGPIHPSKKYYNNELVPYTYNADLAKKIMADAGWADANRNGIVDKLIEGSPHELQLRLMINANNEERKTIALLLQAEAKKVGIDLLIQTVDWAVFLERCASHDFDLMIGKWVGGAGEDDLKQMFHSASAAANGANYMSYSNTQLDSIVEVMQYEMNADKRQRLYYRAQEIIYADVPVLFLYNSVNRMAIDKKIINACPSTLAPGYWAQGFTISSN
jgi:peptide/nickel transport system substrate-binding protein